MKSGFLKDKNPTNNIFSTLLTRLLKPYSSKDINPKHQLSYLGLILKSGEDGIRTHDLLTASQAL